MKFYITVLLGCLTGSALSAEPTCAPDSSRCGDQQHHAAPGRRDHRRFRPFPATHVHDELHARCLVLDDGQTQLALVVCDLLGIHRSVSDEARKLIQQSAGIPPERVLICATHTHSACSALGNRYQPEQPLDEYQQFVVRRIADGVNVRRTTSAPLRSPSARPRRRSTSSTGGGS